MAIEGSLQDVGLADICQLLAMGRKTGCLTITDRSNFGYIYFDRGRVIFASVLNRPDRLGELLLRNGAITADQLSRAMDSQAREPEKRLGQILVEEEMISEEGLNQYISVQIEEAVYYLFTWEEGSFHFDPDQKPEEEGAFLVSIPAESLLMEGARRVDEWSLIEKKVPSFDLIFDLEKDPEGEDLELTEEQRKVIPLLDGHRTVDEIIRESGMIEFDVGKALYGLIQAGFVSQTGRRTAEAEEIGGGGAHQHMNLGTAFYRAGMLEDAEREFRAALAADPEVMGARSHLALICMKNREFERALEHFGVMTDAEGESFGPLMNRALALEELGRHQESLEVLRRARELEPSDPRMLLALGIAQLKIGRAAEAGATLMRHRDQLGGEEPTSMFYAYAVLALAMAGKMEEAIALGREGLTAHPESGAILVNVGVILERQGQREAAEALYLRAVSEADTPSQAHKNLGDMAYRRGDQAGARAHYERAVKIEPELGDDVFVKLGNIAYAEQDQESAQRLWRRALEMNPRNEAVRTNLEALSAAPGS